MRNPFQGGWSWLKERLPLKPKHTDKLAEARRARNAHIATSPAARQSFKLYWRELNKRTALRGIPRADRRRIAKQWYHDVEAH